MTASIIISARQRFFAWLVHLFTASSAVIGLFALSAVVDGNYVKVCWLMGAAIVIDSIDGSFARAVRIKEAIPNFDGALLDNIVDYFNYVLVPAFFLLRHPNVLDPGLRSIIPVLIVLASSYQFCQNDAKTPDHFFKGFPSYWNLAVFHIVIVGLSPTGNAIFLLTLVALVFIPIKYIYPSRLDYLAKSKVVRGAVLMGAILYGVSCFGLLWCYPAPNAVLQGYILFFIAIYALLSVYRTLFPIRS